MTMTALLLTMSLMQDPPAFDATKHPWLRFKPGSSVQFKLSGDLPTSEIEEELKSVEAAGYTLLSSNNPMGLKRSVKKGFGELCAHCDPKAEKVGAENLVVDGRTYACTIWLSKGDPKEFFVKELKVWMAEGIDVPLRIQESVSKGITSNRIVVAVKIGEVVVVGDQKVSCVVLSGTHRIEMRDGPSVDTVKLWLSAEIPGSLVREDRQDPKAAKPVSRAAVAFKAIR